MRPALLVVAVCLAGVLAGSATSSVGARAAGPPDFLFKRGFNLCKAASLTAMQQAGGRSYSPGRFQRGAEPICIWSLTGSNSAIFLTAYPAGAKQDGMPLAALVKLQLGAGILKSIRLPGASSAGIQSDPEQHIMSVWAVYQQRVVDLQITDDLTSPATAKRRAIALIRLVTHTQ